MLFLYTFRSVHQISWIINVDGMEQDSLDFLRNVPNRCEVILQWTQRLVVDAGNENLLDVPPPILSRVFQDLSGGIVKLNAARKIKEVPVPFAYAQMMFFMLLVWTTPT